MKKLLFFLILLFCLPAFCLIHGQTSELYIGSTGDVDIYFDGEKADFSNRLGIIVIRGIEPGWHTVGFYKNEATRFEEQIDMEPDMAYIYMEPLKSLTEKMSTRDINHSELQPSPSELTFEFLDASEMQAPDFDEFEDLMDEEGPGEVFFIVENMPQFDGGPPDNFRNYIGANLKYPPIAAENGIQGRVYVQFTVNKAGQVVDVVIARGVDPALDEEALRVVKSSPSWTPGTQRSRPVNVRFTFPIVFKLTSPDPQPESGDLVPRPESE